MVGALMTKNLMRYRLKPRVGGINNIRDKAIAG
jgi:hypothetical protein